MARYTGYSPLPLSDAVPAALPAEGKRAVRSGASARLAGIRRLVAPVLIVAVVLALSIASGLVKYHGNLAGFIQFGREFAGDTHPPAGAPVNSPLGYDGQFFYVQALDPLLLHNSTVSALHAAGAGFRMQRFAYPALAFLLAAGQRGAIPFTLLAINVIVAIALAGGFAVYARRRGWSTLWAVPIALMPGMLLPVLRDLSDPLATATMLAGLLLWAGGRRWPAALALTVAVLSREVMVLAVLAVAAEAGVRMWRSRGEPGAWRAILAAVWPVIALPAAAFALWEAYVTIRYGGAVGGSDVGLPFVNLVNEVTSSIRQDPAPEAGFDLIYVLLMVAASAAAFRSLRNRVTVTSAGAAALSLGVLVPTLGDVWSDTRLSAPLFALLLVDGLQRRDRVSVRIAGAAAAMTVLVGVTIPGAL
jgi:hypothetical protein